MLCSSARLYSWVAISKSMGQPIDRKSVESAHVNPFFCVALAALIHHQTSGSLDQRGIGDVSFLTVKEFNQLNKRKRLLYRILRHPLFIFVAGPFYFLFILRFNRKCYSQHKYYSKKVGRSIFLTNISLVFFYTICFYFLGAQFLLFVYLPVICCASVLETWVFFIQHGFPEAYFRNDKERNHIDAALKGSSYYKLPRILAWLTAYIGYHHIHHLLPKIPSYHLTRCFNDNNFLQSPVTYQLKDTLILSRLMFYDEEKQRAISWAEYKKFY